MYTAWTPTSATYWLTIFWLRFLYGVIWSSSKLYYFVDFWNENTVLPVPRTTLQFNRSIPSVAVVKVLFSFVQKKKKEAGLSLYFTGPQHLGPKCFWLFVLLHSKALRWGCRRSSFSDGSSMQIMFVEATLHSRIAHHLPAGLLLSYPHI